MRVFNRRIVPEDGIKPTAVALGFFDGVHIGHQAVISAARDAAVAAGWQPAVFTFTQPSGQSTKGRQIITLDQKNHVLAELGVQYCFEPPFESFSALSPEAFFAEMLMGEYRAKALFCGENYGFGAKRAGNVQRLRELWVEQDRLQEEHGIHEVEAVHGAGIQIDDPGDVCHVEDSPQQDQGIADAGGDPGASLQGDQEKRQAGVDGQTDEPG